jgi:hypothetical protein
VRVIHGPACKEVLTIITVEKRREVICLFVSTEIPREFRETTLKSLRRFVLHTLPVGFLGLLLYACRTTAPPPETLAPQAVTQTMHAAASLIAKLEQTPPAATFSPPKIVTPAPTLTPADTATPAPLFVHIDVPKEPPGHTSELSDRSSAPFADEKRAIGDSYDRNIFERPFTSEEMVYQGYLDIAPGAELSLAPPWVYVSIFLVAAPQVDTSATYGIELDLNLDGRGDWLIVASTPLSSEWSTNGVRAFLDSNRDVGGETAAKADSTPPHGDGYEILIFDQGISHDPDAVFARLLTDPTITLQLAFKHSFIGNDKTLIWGAWAFGDEFHPEWFEYNDYITFAQAGSPKSTSSYYPLKALASVDSTCRWIQGILPRRNMPNLCGYSP